MNLMQKERWKDAASEKTQQKQKKKDQLLLFSYVRFKLE